jgi:hypothetical protein
MGIAKTNFAAHNPGENSGPLVVAAAPRRNAIPVGACISNGLAERSRLKIPTTNGTLSSSVFAAHIGGCSPAAPLTRNQRSTVHRRQRILDLVAELKAAGWSEAKAVKFTSVDLVAELKAAGWSEARAAKFASASTSSLWRWRRCIVPQWNYCGRSSIFDTFKITPNLISKVQKLRIAGLSNQNAWRALANIPSCPKDLAAYLRHAPAIPPKFFAAIRLTKIRATVCFGKNFTHISQPLNSR